MKTIEVKKHLGPSGRVFGICRIMGLSHKEYEADWNMYWCNTGLQDNFTVYGYVYDNFGSENINEVTSTIRFMLLIDFCEQYNIPLNGKM